MQTCFFAISGVLPRDEAIAEIKATIKKTYGKRGETVLQQNYAGVDTAIAELFEVKVPASTAGDLRRLPAVPAYAPDFVKRVTAMMIEGKGDLLPVSAMPVDGTFPTGTARYEKRSIALSIPIWDPDICIQCGLCSLVCPHAAIRTKVFPTSALEDKPAGYQSEPYSGKEYPGFHLTIQVAPDDCTGCGVCVDVCPARSKEMVKHKAINMEPKLDHLEVERANFDFFLEIPEIDRKQVKFEVVKGSQLLQPLFEFSGACPGCGETPYLKLMSQLFGDRAMIGNATGCSSIYGGNLPTTPVRSEQAGQGADLVQLAVRGQRRVRPGNAAGRRSAGGLCPRALAADVLGAGRRPGAGDPRVAPGRRRRDRGPAGPGRRARSEARRSWIRPRHGLLLGVADALIRRSVWIVGGDGWAYDIGFGGLDHVLASGRDVNILVLDTEVYSNTGGQASKSTPRAAVAKYASGGKAVGKKDLGMMAVDYGNVYVATVAMGANPLQTLKAFREAEAYRGTSLMIAYSTCIAHGIDMTTSMTHQKEAITSGYWPLYRYDPRAAHDGSKPFHLDSRKPTTAFKEFALKEGRYAMLARANPAQAERLLELAQKDINDRWHFYEQMAGIERTVSPMEEAAR